MKKALFNPCYVLCSLIFLSSNAFAGAWLATEISYDTLGPNSSGIADGVIDSVMYTDYDENGIPLKNEFDEDNDGDIDSTVYNTFDEDNNQYEVRMDSDNDGDIDFTQIYTYDENGFNTVLEQYDGEGNLKEVYYSTDDANGNTIKIEKDLNADGVIDSISYRTYDGNNNCILEEEDENADGVIDSVSYKTYDGDGNCIKEETDTDNDGIIDITVNSTYNDKGHVTYMETETVVGLIGLTVYIYMKFEYTYDTNGNITIVETLGSASPNFSDVTTHSFAYTTWEYFEGADGDSDGTGDTDDGSGTFEFSLYFPHIAADTSWGTEICLINKSATQTASGSLSVYDDNGNQVAQDLNIDLSPNERRQIVIGEQFANADDIGYAIYASDSDDIIGYTKFFIPGTYRVAVPATSTINSGDIYVSHIASDAEWWTGISLVNTTSTEKTLTIEFDDGQTINKTIAANEHQAFTIAGLFGGQPQSALKSAVIKNAAGIIGLELFGSNATSYNKYLSGILLTDQTTTEIYYPHVASDTQWWTGVVAYNPASTDCDLTITAFSQDGTILNMSDLTLGGKEKYIGTAGDLGFSANTAWFSIVASSPVTGFELFGTTNGKQLGGYTGVGIQRNQGVFAKIEKQGWTGIAFVNTEATSADITISAYDDDGTPVASESLTLDAYEKLVGVADQLFSQDISDATYIAFTSSNQVVGFQLNGSSDGMMLDALPGM